MPECTASFDTGVNGANILTTDNGSATAWNTRGQNGSSAMTYDNSRFVSTPLSAKFFFPGSSTQCYLQWDTAFGTQTNHYGRYYVYMDAYPTGGASDYWLEFFNGVSQTAGFKITTTGTIRPGDSAGDGTAGNVPIALQRFVRIEWHVIHNTSTGSIEIKLFNEPQSLTPSETILYSGRNTGAQSTAMMVGSNNTSTQLSTIWVDQIIGGVTYGYPGPYYPPGPADVPFVPLGRGSA